MGKKTYCNVYEDDKLIMEHVTQREIADRLNFSANKVWHSLGSRNKLDGKYTIEILEEVPQKTFEERWNEVVAPFARVQWIRRWVSIEQPMQHSNVLQAEMMEYGNIADIVSEGKTRKDDNVNRNLVRD